MKPCRRYRRRIAWLALDALDTQEKHHLQKHLESCVRCRGYLGEIRTVSAQVGSAEPAPEIQTSEAFHRAWMNRLRQNTSRSPWEWGWAYLHQAFHNRNVAGGAVAAMVLALILAFILWRSPDGSPPTGSTHDATAGIHVDADLPPSIGSYQRVAAQSLEQLDTLLTKQGNRRLPPSPIYRVSMRTLPNMVD